MEVRPGYKQTEVGVIPVGWGARKLGELASFHTGPFGSALHKSDYTDDGVPVVNPMHIIDGQIVPTRTMTITESAATKLTDFRLKLGEVIIGRRGDMGRCAVVRKDHLGWLCGTGSMIVRPLTGVDAEFLQRVLSSPTVVSAIEDLSVGSTMINLNQGTLAGLVIQAPPLPEQRAIAAVLSDVDTLLAKLDALIAKKRDLKQATMQQLLNGRTRLPGFSGEWDIASLDQIVTRTTGFWGAANYNDMRPRCAQIIRAGDISPDGELTATATRFLSEVEFARAQCQLDEVVITTSGNGLGKVWWSDGRADVTASNFVRILRPTGERANGRFLYYALRSEEGQQRLQEHTATSAYPNLRPTYFSACWIPLPPIIEQTALATVLSDMDAELTALEARRDKTRTLKQGMMQELLTGRMRLV